MKPKIAIFDMTDCEGCEIEFLNFRKALLDFDQKVDIVNWRLLEGKSSQGPFDIAFVEGNPLTLQEKQELIAIRKQSKTLIALGACASIGGVQAALDKDQRYQATRKIYGTEYKLKHDQALPLENYIQVDFKINGCPINPNELKELVEDLLSAKKPKEKDFPVCLECKARFNECLLLKDMPCLGPITRAGCGAICVHHGIACFGCWGPVPDPNVKALINSLKKILTEREIQKRFQLITQAVKEYHHE